VENSFSNGEYMNIEKLHKMIRKLKHKKKSIKHWKKKSLLKYFKLGEKCRGGSRIVKQIKGHNEEKKHVEQQIIRLIKNKGEKRVKVVTCDKKKSEVEEVMLLEEPLPCFCVFSSCLVHSCPILKFLSKVLGLVSLTKDPLETSSSKVP